MTSAPPRLRPAAVRRLHDKGWSNAATGVSWAVTVLAWLFSELGRVSLGWLLLGVVVLDVGTQAQRILNQTRAFALSDEARSRVNTAYVAGNFVGAALGSLAASGPPPCAACSRSGRDVGVGQVEV